MRAAHMIFVLFIIVTSCAAPSKTATVRYHAHELTEAEKQRIKGDLLGALNVEDALFSTVRAAVSPSGEITVCGWIRVKSDFADYAKYPDNRPFVVTYTYVAEQLEDVRLVQWSEDIREAPKLYAQCSALGIPL